jgi:SAM-dependent methyltransferase
MILFPPFVAAMSRVLGESAGVDRANARFWNELCGTTLADREAIAGQTAEALSRFDDAYIAFYPYLLEYVNPARMAGRSVLEIGLGYGTLGQRIVAAGSDYHAVDLAEGPLYAMASRLHHAGSARKIVRATSAVLPFGSNSFDYVVSIGCLHHTGRLTQCVDEVRRVLKPGGTAIVMLYNQFSYRRWMRSPLRTIGAFLHERVSTAAQQRATERERRLYDVDSAHEAAPETVFVSERGIRRLFAEYSGLETRKANCDDLVPLGRFLRLRERFLPIVGRRAGLDIYITARK